MVDIDWEQLARELETLHDHGESGSNVSARHALERIVGEDALRASVDYYVELRPGFELARSVLWQLHPLSAMERCYELFRESDDIEVRRSAVERLRVVADARALPWIEEFLADRDGVIQMWGVGILDQLLFSELVAPDAVEDLVHVAQQHANPSVANSASEIRHMLAARLPEPE